MTNSPLTAHSNHALQSLRTVMLVCGTVEALAAIAVVLPRDLMSTAYRQLQLGDMPDAALFGYLARSASLLWAVHGVLVIGLARDVLRYLPIIGVLGWLTIAMGAAFVWIDLSEGMPLWWTALEGPIVLVMGIIFVRFAGAVLTASDSARPLSASNFHDGK